MQDGATDTTLRILHLEDSPADQQLTRLTLRRAGWNADILAVDTLQAFQDALDHMDCDVVLADYHLPGFTALDAWALLTRHPNPPPFILLSGAIGEAAAVEAIRQGMADYVLKDDLARLPHVIERALEVHNARKAQARAAVELAASRQSLAELTEHLQTSIEQERAAIAREIHDDIGGALTAVLFDLSWIGRHAQQAPVQEHAQAATAMLQHALGASQRIMMNLRPPVLDQGLVAAVQWLAKNFERRTGITVQLRSSAARIPMAPDVQLVAYRTAQEALTNVSKHAQATHVRIELSDDENVLTLEVSDDGQGLSSEARAKAKAFGLRGLQERARTVGGWLDVSSRPGQGTSVIVSIPLPPHGAPTTAQEIAP